MNNKDAEGHLTAILLYHRMGLPRLGSLVAGQYIAPALLKSQINYLNRRLWQPTGLVNALDLTSPYTSDRYAITFDDGYLSVYDKAVPILLDSGVSATVYVVTEHIGGINAWDRNSGDCVETMMSNKHIAEMHKAGFEIGSHTRNHPHLTQLSDSELRAEIVDSKKQLEDLLGVEVSSFSYPYGDYDERVRNVVVEAGYKNGVSTMLGTFTRNVGMFDIPRVNVRWNSFGLSLLKKIHRGARKSIGA